jgi:putative hydrolase of the HAD superfamily
MRIDGIVFDFGETLAFYEGTALNWSEHYRPALRGVAQACGIEVTAAGLDFGQELLGRFNTRVVPRTHEVAASEIFAELLDSWQPGRRELLDEAERAFFRYFQRRLTVYADTAAALAGLSRAGLPMSVLSDVPYGMNRSLFEQDLRDAQLADFFVSVFTSVDVGFRKPSPSGLLCVSRALEIEPERLAYVGNEQKDITAANEAGFTAILIDRSGNTRIEGADITIASLTDLLRLLA